MDSFGLPIVEIVKYYLIFKIANFLWSKRASIPIVLCTFRRDVCLLYTLYIKMLLSWIGRRRRNETLCKSLDKMVEIGSDGPCFYFGEEIWTYKQVQTMSFRVANYFQDKGLKKGDSVGLAMTNRPENVAIWLGLGRLGVVTVMINTNLRGDSLEKCASVVECKALIIGTELRQAFEEIWNGDGRELLPSDIYELDRFLETPNWKPENMSDQARLFPTVNLAQCLLKAGKEPTVVPTGQEPNFLDPLLYLFTSGTTGVPKAVRCSHGRLFFVSSIACTLNFTSTDKSYSAVPMYHMVGLFSVVWAFCYGTPTVVVVKFTATNFWKHIHQYKATVCIYIGEFCRFLMNQPVDLKLEKGHTLRAMFGGGGLRADVWTAFIERFGINNFCDIYASTEGNCTMINLEGKVGACGYIPIWFQHIHPIQLVKVDESTGEIFRDLSTGFAIRCKDDEPGELIGKIVDGVPMARYDGYTDRGASKKKIAHNVFKEGDKYYKSGDFLSRDKYGYFYFQDRLGDTLRWHSENVATTLVENVISRLTGMRNNVVYGVKVPGTEGSAGMAAILDSYDGEFDIQRLAKGLKESLPKYAIPMFIRLVNKRKGIDMTGTFKFQKFQLKEDGFNVEKIEDTVFIYSTEMKAYRKMDLETFKIVRKGNFRF